MLPLLLPRPSVLRRGILADPCNSYFVTELLGTDLHRLLTSRPLEKQFIQYFLYQIMVSPASLSLCPTPATGADLASSAA